MLYFLVALFLFFDAVLIHLIVCRKTKKEGLFLKIFFLIAGVNLGICWFLFELIKRFVHELPNVWLIPLPWTSTVFYILLIPTYLVFYFSTQQMSPSKKIMLLLIQSKGMTFEQLLVHFQDEELIKPRIEDLLMTGCIAQRSGRYELTVSGNSMARIYALYQVILGRKKGG